MSKRFETSKAPDAVAKDNEASNPRVSNFQTRLFDILKADKKGNAKAEEIGTGNGASSRVMIGKVKCVNSA